MVAQKRQCPPETILPGQQPRGNRQQWNELLSFSRGEMVNSIRFVTANRIWKHSRDLFLRILLTLVPFDIIMPVYVAGTEQIIVA